MQIDHCLPFRWSQFPVLIPRADLARAQAWGRQCDDAILLQGLLDQRLRGRSRRARSISSRSTRQTCIYLRNRLVGRALPAPEPAPHDFIEVSASPVKAISRRCSDACAEQAAGLLVNGDVIFRVGTISLSAVTARYALPLTPTSVAMK